LETLIQAQKGYFGQQVKAFPHFSPLGTNLLSTIFPQSTFADNKLFSLLPHAGAQSESQHVPVPLGAGLKQTHFVIPNPHLLNHLYSATPSAHHNDSYSSS
jgi:hypothetical protein